MSHHIIPRTTYFVIFGLLLALLAATVGAAMVPLGPWSVVVALGIALAKGTLIVLYFMHVRYSNSLVQVFSVAGFLWLALLFLLLFSDYLTRYDVIRATVGDSQGHHAEAAQGSSIGRPASFQSDLPAS